MGGRSEEFQKGWSGRCQDELEQQEGRVEHLDPEFIN